MRRGRNHDPRQQRMTATQRVANAHWPVCALRRVTLSQGQGRSHRASHPPQAYVMQGTQGGALSKPATVQRIKAFAAHLEGLTGHSMQTIGAQRMAAAGLSTEQINAFGRWRNSAQMVKYVREALIGAGRITNTMRRFSLSTSSAPSSGSQPSTGSKTHVHEQALD